MLNDSNKISNMNPIFLLVLWWIPAGSSYELAKKNAHYLIEQQVGAFINTVLRIKDFY